MSEFSASDQEASEEERAFDIIRGRFRNVEVLLNYTDRG